MYLRSFCIETTDPQTGCPWPNINIVYRVIKYAMVILNMYLYIYKKKIWTPALLQYLPELIEVHEVGLCSFFIETTDPLHATIACMHYIFNYPLYIINIP